MTREQEEIALDIVAFHGDAAGRFMLDQIDAARGVRNVIYWHQVGERVADILEPSGLPN